MWSCNCVYCKQEIKNGQACYFVYKGVEKVGYRHVNCFPQEQPKDYYEPFGHVTDEKGELD